MAPRLAKDCHKREALWTWTWLVSLWPPCVTDYIYLVVNLLDLPYLYRETALIHREEKGRGEEKKRRKMKKGGRRNTKEKEGGGEKKEEEKERRKERKRKRGGGQEKKGGKQGVPLLRASFPLKQKASDLNGGGLNMGEKRWPGAEYSSLQVGRNFLVMESLPCSV